MWSTLQETHISPEMGPLWQSGPKGDSELGKAAILAGLLLLVFREDYMYYMSIMDYMCGLL